MASRQHSRGPPSRGGSWHAFSGEEVVATGGGPRSQAAGAGMKTEQPQTECCHLASLRAKGDPGRSSETLPPDRHSEDIDFILKFSEERNVGV